MGVSSAMRTLMGEGRVANPALTSADGSGAAM
jgi:hypothetical protein